MPINHNHNLGLFTRGSVTGAVVSAGGPAGRVGEGDHVEHAEHLAVSVPGARLGRVRTVCRLGSVTENQYKVEKNNGDFPHVDCEEADCDWWGQFIRFYRRVSVHRFSNEHPHVEQGLARSKASYHVGTGRHQNKEDSIFTQLK